jgi:hypothetical protein
MSAGEHHIIGVSPETATSKWFLKMVESAHFKRHLHAFIIDEAHCVHTWSWRVAFTTLLQLARLDVQVTAATATLTTKVEPLVIGCLGLASKALHRVKRSVIKYNLSITVRIRPGDSDTERRWCKYYLDPIIVRLRRYTREGVDMPRVLMLCKTATMMHTVYHYIFSCLGADAYSTPGSTDYRDSVLYRIFSEHDPRVKRHVFEWVKDKRPSTKVVVGTSLLEMGHDCVNLCHIVLIGLPSTLIHLLQSLGRGSRLPNEWCHALILHNATDYAGVEDELVDLVKDTTRCFHVNMYRHFGEKYVRPPDPPTGQPNPPCCHICDDAYDSSITFPLPVCPLPAKLTLEADVDLDSRRMQENNLRTALLESEINTLPPLSNPWAPLPEPGESQRRRVGGGVQRALCIEYATSFAAGLDMAAYTYDVEGHRGIVLQCISHL